MPPNANAVLEKSVTSEVEEKPQYKTRILWFNVFLCAFLHTCLLYGIYLTYTSAQIKTCIFALIYGYVGGMGITAGCHRLWCHRSYKAKWPLRLFLCMISFIALQKDIYTWCRDHRVHHKFTDTDADPHNIRRGFFFAHVGWLMCKKHPEVYRKGKTVHMGDIWDDPIVRFNKRFYVPFAIFFCFYLPTMIPVWFWGETAWNAFFVAAVTRYTSSLHVTFCVNSIAHWDGDKPYDSYIEARENPFVAFIAGGEGWHNYHHVFPWDYSTSELGYSLNLTKMFIDFLSLFGLAYDMKTVHPDIVNRTKMNASDGFQSKFTEMDQCQKRG